jgi:hypothetical protein
LWFTSRGSWNDLRSGFGSFKDWIDAKRLIVTSLPHAPESEGDQMNQIGADNGYASAQRALGGALTAMGLNSPYMNFRVDWESNGNWYHWSSDRPGGAQASRDAIKNFVINMRAGGLTKANFTMCFNKGPSQSGHDFDTFPGAEYIASVGVDQYDMWNPAFDSGQWAGELAKSPSVRSVADFADAHQIMWSLDEGGNTHGGGNAYGGDNPYYWEAMDASIRARIGTCAWHNTYDEVGAPATLHHDFDSNPQSFVRYKSLWRPGR